MIEAIHVNIIQTGSVNKAINRNTQKFLIRIYDIGPVQGLLSLWKTIQLKSSTKSDVKNTSRFRKNHKYPLTELKFLAHLASIVLPEEQKANFKLKRGPRPF